jgi:hypothetical protein
MSSPTSPFTTPGPRLPASPLVNPLSLSDSLLHATRLRPTSAARAPCSDTPSSRHMRQHPLCHVSRPVPHPDPHPFILPTMLNHGSRKGTYRPTPPFSFLCEPRLPEAPTPFLSLQRRRFADPEHRSSPASTEFLFQFQFPFL